MLCFYVIFMSVKNVSITFFAMKVWILFKYIFERFLLLFITHAVAINQYYHENCYFFR